MTALAPRLHHRLARDHRGATLVEFAIVAPVMLLTIMALCDFTYRGYVQAILTGAVQRAGRDAGLEGGPTNAAALDTRVRAAVQVVARDATVVSRRSSYADYGKIAPEPFTDSNANNMHDAGECYSDINGNNQWDADPGATGQGGANDVTVYTITVTYQRLFPLFRFLGLPNDQVLKSTTIFKNQPYDTQSNPTPATICT